MPWWPVGPSEVTLHRILVHLRADNDNLAPGDREWWRATAAGWSGWPGEAGGK